MSHMVAKAIDIDRSHLLDEDLGAFSVDQQRWPEGRRPGTSRRWRHEHHRSGKQRIRLDDDTKTATPLLVADTPRWPKLVDVTPLHGGSP